MLVQGRETERGENLDETDVIFTITQKIQMSSNNEISISKKCKNKNKSKWQVTLSVFSKNKNTIYTMQ